MTRHSKRHEAPGGVAFMLLGTLASALLTAVLTFIFSFISYSTKNPDSTVGIFSIIALILTAAVTGFTVSRLKGEGGVLIATLSSLLFTLILLLIGLIAGGGSLPLGCIINYLCFIAVSALAAVLGRRRGRRVRR
ncbi:MAG: TIGR04086 family membrane protein [Clostridia bacterium]|nr:TIGR04086 family membrane protein [Clostridia bacterium]